MIEKFKEIKLDGSIRINLQEKGYWEASKRDIINAIVDICEDYENQGYKLTLRQLYYQLVSKDYIPNHDKVYKKLSSIKDEVVYGGLVDWAIFEDRGRVPHKVYHEEGVKEALEYTARVYRIDRQQNQKTHVEVWTEKDAISSILKKATNEKGITVVVNKGYTSSTAIYGAYERFINHMGEGQKVHVLYFGDHDPSGLDMVRDIYERLMFMFVSGERNHWDEDAWKVDWSENPVYFNEIITRWSGDMIDGKEDDWEGYTDECDEYYDNEDCQTAFSDGSDTYFDVKKAFFKHHFRIEQIGLTMDQIRGFNPPPNPAKITDPRAKEYIKKHGQVSWEVDALSPSTMIGIVKEAINEIIDLETYEETLNKEKREKMLISSLVRHIDTGEKDEEEDDE